MVFYVVILVSFSRNEVSLVSRNEVRKSMRKKTGDMPIQGI